MMKRPVSVTIIGWVFIGAGLIGIAYHVKDFDPQRPFEAELILATLVRLLAAVCGVYMLRGSNWARWVALAWMAYHVVLSAFHSAGEFAMHSVLFAVIAFFLLRPPATRYFRAGSTALPAAPSGESL